MVPNVNARGTSFKGVTAYLMHDKEKAQTSERVEWTTTRNMVTDNIETASKIMAFTDTNSEDIKRDFSGSSAGSKREVGAVYHFSLSEAPENNPTQEKWEKYIDENIKVIGLEGHQYYMVSHNDEPHAHVHVVVNLVHPETGLVKSPYNDYKKMDRLAHEYELENGIVCEERDKKYKAWEQEQKAFKEKERREEYSLKVTQAFQQSDNSQSFKSALEHEGLTLAQGNRRGFVLVDGQGQIFALNRLISFDDDIKRKEKNAVINDKLEGIDKAALPVANKLQEQRQTIDREAEEVKKQNALLDAAEEHAQEQIKIDNKIEVETLNILNQKRTEIYKQAKADWRDIKALHSQELRDTRKEMSELSELRLKEHNERWTALIEEEKHKQIVLQCDLAKEGLAGVYFRFRYGKETRQEIENIDKNIANAQMRLDGGIIGKTRQDLEILKIQQAEQREALKTRIDEELINVREESKQEAERKINNVDIKENIELERLEESEIISDTFNKTNIAGEDMARNKSSREKWEMGAFADISEDIAARAQQQNKSVDDIMEQDEAKRQELEDASKVTVEPISDEQIREDLESLKELENQPEDIEPSQAEIDSKGLSANEFEQPEMEQSYGSGQDQSQDWFNEEATPKEELSIEERKAILIEQNLQEINEKSEQIDHDHSEGLER